MTKVKKGERLVCEPCGREVVVDSSGISDETVWCCNQPMATKKTRTKGKKTKR